ncbi:MAG: xanthine dehydrogenase family protein molybdopterin-binding subunit [Candidatus Binatia bacterium]
MSYYNIGKSIGHVEGREKVSGGAKYSADRIFPGTVWGKCLRSPLPHAKILGIDTAKAEALPGVLAVLTAKHIPSVLTGRRIRDMPMLAQDRVRFIGEKIAVVASEDPGIAEQAVSLIDVEYADLPAVFDPVEAMSEGSPILHENLKDYVNVPQLAAAIPNVHSILSWELGDLKKGFQDADRVFEHTFKTQRVHQGYLEPYASVVLVEPSGRVQLWMTNKAIYFLREFMAGAISVPETEIVINQSAIGGDFGGKGALMDSPLCYFLAQRLNRPVKMVMTYAEDLQAGNPRHPSIVTIRTGVKKNGRICAREAKAIFNSGAYGAFKPTPPVNLPGSLAAIGPYAIPNGKIHAYSVYTNSVPCGHMRAPGEAQVTFAQESSIDMIAHDLGISPDEFRRMNLIKDGDLLPDGKRLIHVQARKTLDAAIHASNWGKTKPKRNVGRGMSISYRVIGVGQATAQLTLGTDGTVTLVTTIMDQGAGAHTILLQVVAEVLGLSMDRVKISVGNTDTFRNDTAPGASRVTHVAGMAAYRAAAKLKAFIKRLAAENLACSEERISLTNGFCKGPSENTLSFADLALWVEKKRERIEVTETYEPKSNPDEEIVYFSAQIAEVEVDPETGAIKVNQITTAHDVGTVINPLSHQGQIDGGLIQGLGFTLMEDLSDDQGQITTLSLGDYKIPNINDIPKLKTVLVVEPTGPAPFKAKAIGENSIDLVAPAVANALFHATGIRILELPLTAEKVYLALHRT